MNFLVPLALKDKEMKYIAASAKQLGEYLRMPIVRKRVVLLPRFSAEWGKPRSSIELLRFATFLCARFTIYTDEDGLLAPPPFGRTNRATFIIGFIGSVTTYPRNSNTGT